MQIEVTIAAAVGSPAPTLFISQISPQALVCFHAVQGTVENRVAWRFPWGVVDVIGERPILMIHILIEECQLWRTQLFGLLMLAAQHCCRAVRISTVKSHFPSERVIRSYSIPI
jgi:hypothetical protein